MIHPGDVGIADRKSTTYCLGYWQIPGNAKRALAHYATLLPSTLSMLAGKSLVFLSDDVVVQRWVEALGRDRGVTVRSVRRELMTLPAVGFADQIVRQTQRYGAGSTAPLQFSQEKGLLHYWRDFTASGAEAYRQILAIWLSKVLLTQEVIDSDPFGSEHFAWVDATASRFNGERPNWNFAEVEGRSGSLAHYSSRMRKQGRALSLNASFLKGDRHAWERVHTLYLEELGRAVDEVYPNDEETVLHDVVQAHPDLFRALDREAIDPASRGSS
jgi:hypothetical protein